MDKKIVPVPGAADTIMRHGLKPGGEVLAVFYIQVYGRINRSKNANSN